MDERPKILVELSAHAYARLLSLVQDEYNMHLTPGDDAAMDEAAVALGLNLDSL